MKEYWFTVQREGEFYWVFRDGKLISSVSPTFLPAFGLELEDGEDRQFALISDDEEAKR